jgi:hypothetical protein
MRPLKILHILRVKPIMQATRVKGEHFYGLQIGLPEFSCTPCQSQSLNPTREPRGHAMPGHVTMLVPPL